MNAKQNILSQTDVVSFLVWAIVLILLTVLWVSFRPPAAALPGVSTQTPAHTQSAISKKP